MATKETRRDEGIRRGRLIVRRLVGELSDARRLASLSRQAMAAGLGKSQSDVSRFERLVDIDRISFVEVSAVAHVLRLELSAGLHLLGEPLRDKGHQVPIQRFIAILSPVFRVMREVPLPNPGDLRAWDLLLRLPAQVIGVEAETRVRDLQRLVRHIHVREQDGGADAVVLLLAATRTNRDLVDQLRLALGPRFATPPRQILSALRAGQPLSGSGVFLF